MKKGAWLLFLGALIIFIFSWTGLSAQEEDDSLNLDIEVPELKQDSGKSENSASSQTSVSEKNYQFQGKLASFTAGGFEDPQSILFHYDRLQLELTQIYGSVTFYAKGNARYNTVYENDQDAYGRGENIRLDLTEAYVNTTAYPGSFLTQWDLKIGQQVINWGKADEMRPTDILSPQDLTLLVLEDRLDRKLGRFAVKSMVSLGDHLRLEGIWMPIQRASDSTKDSKSPFTPLSLIHLQNMGYSVNTTQMPERKLSHSDVALKLYASIFDIDLSFSFYNGYDPLPFSKIVSSDPIFPQNGGTVLPFLSRVTFWGVDFERAVGGIVVRGEAAYFTKGMLFSTFSPSDHPELYAKYVSSGNLAQKDSLDMTLGFDKNDLLIPRLYLNLQYSLNWIKDFEKGLKSRYGTKLDQANHTGIFNLAYEWGNLTYRAEIAGNYNFSQKDWMLNPTFQVKIGPETKLIFGAYLFFGDEDTLMGQYDQKDFGYLQLEHLF